MPGTWSFGHAKIINKDGAHCNKMWDRWRAHLVIALSPKRLEAMAITAGYLGCRQPKMKMLWKQLSVLGIMQT